MEKRTPRDIGGDDVKFEWWIKAVKEIGFPTIVAGLLLYGAYLLLVRVADITTRLVDSHSRFLDVQMDQTKQQTTNSGKILDSLKGIEEATEAATKSNEYQTTKLGELVDSNKSQIDRLESVMHNQRDIVKVHEDMLKELKKANQ